MDEEITRAASSTSTSKRKTSTTSTAKKKTGTTTSNRKTSSSTAKKKPSASTSARKKTSTSSTIRLTAAEKKMITNYRKCGTLQKQIIALLIEKLAGGLTKLDGIERLIDDQGSLL